MKNKIRDRVLRDRKSLPSERIAAKSRAIAERVLRLPEFKAAGTVMFYVSQGSEVETRRLIEETLQSGRKVAVPVAVPEGRGLIPVLIRDPDRELSPGSQGVLEPDPGNGRAIDPSEIDLIILPGVAFDSQGNRLGRGKAYYDNFLKKLRKEACKVALAFERQIVEEIPPASHDVPVDKIVTEKRVIDCKKNSRTCLPAGRKMRTRRPAGRDNKKLYELRVL